MVRRTTALDRHPIQGDRILLFRDTSGRTLQSGDMIRTTRYPRSWQFKIRHLFRTPKGKLSVETYGPYDKYGKVYTQDVRRVPHYASFALDEVAAKVRE